MQLLERVREDRWIGFAEAELTRDHDDIEVAREAALGELQPLEVCGTVGEQRQAMASGRGAHDLLGALREGMTLALSLHEGRFHLPGELGILDAELAERTPPRR